MTVQRDIVVIGAGPAGCSAALYLAAQGFGVAVIDQARFPRPKPCGEGVMPSGIPVLRELGVLEEVRRQGRRFHGIQYTSLTGSSACGLFREGTYGITVPREILDWILLQKAKSFRNVEVLESHRVLKLIAHAARVQGVLATERSVPPEEGAREILGTYTLIADGALSTTTEALGLKRRFPSSRRYGMRAHFDGVEGLRDLVEVFFLGNGEVYLAPQPGGGSPALLAVLVGEDGLAPFSGRTQMAFQEMVLSSKALAGRLAHAVQTTRIMGLGPLAGWANPWHGPGWMVLGDAASSVDPITGEGIALALRNGKLAAQEITAALHEGRPDVSGYTWKRRKLIGRQFLLSRALLQISKRPPLAEGALRFLSRHPKIFNALLLSACGG